MSKGTKTNLTPSQEAKVDDRKKHVIDALVTLHSKKRKFDDVTELSERIADMVALSERSAGNPESKPHYTTFIRNKRNGDPTIYRLLLDRYIDGTFDPADPEGKKKLTKKDVENYIKSFPPLRQYISGKDLEISNLKRERAVAEGDLDSLKKQLQSKNVGQISEGAGNLETELRKAKTDLGKTCTWINRFIENECRDWLKIDKENETIINLAKRNKSIGDERLMEPFFRVIKGRDVEVID